MFCHGARHHLVMCCFSRNWRTPVISLLSLRGRTQGVSNAEAAEARKVEALEAKVREKNEVMAELMGEHVALKKTLGEI